MRKSVHGRLSRLLAIPFCTCVLTAPAAAADLLALPFEELAQLEVSIATGSPKRLAESPAATSVITARELEAMGVQDIGEALEAVPGLHVSNGSFQYAPRYFLRGITSTYNPHTLVLLNGIPQTSLFVGDRGERLPGIYSLPVRLLDRIEVIRGPGSALYGADAFAGVINLITRSPVDARGGQLSASTGSFDTTRAHFMQAGTVGRIRGLFSAAWLETDGDSSAVITRDAQSIYDDAGLTAPASLAPGTVPTSARGYDLRNDLVLGDFQLRMGWMHAWDTGTGHGINDALDPESRFEHHRGNIDLGWRRDDITPDWEAGIRVSYLYGDFRNNGLLLYPPGSFYGSFPDGLLGRPNLSEESARADIDALFTGLADHRLRFGAGFYWGDLFKTTDLNNYLNGAPRPAPVDVSDTAAVFQPENQRTSHYLFAQDEWSLARDWELTAGLRYDHYSDVGGTANPRLALVWATSPTLTSKLIYGEAFRPPAFFELYGTSNPVALGNPGLKPEKLRSVELAFNWKPDDRLSWDLNVYALQIQDFIDFVSDPGQMTFTARNAARIRGTGLETELRRQIGEQLQLLANYSLQRTRDQGGGSLGLAPRDEAHVRATWALLPRWQFNSQLNWTGMRERQATDPRSALDGYLTADVALRHMLRRRLDLSLVARNLFDADVREASRGPGPGQTSASLPGDLPQAGRSVTLEVTSRW
ncbi:MAG: TonB-dependent receptor [Moraxellaceae bacterium]|jgi:iron complex outermembrane receptor protein|nr:TonB-dependent receptor [Moraxellaceae bacterium]